MSEARNSEGFFDETGIKPVRLVDWLNTACSNSEGNGIPPIRLPMIQRDSVWKPHQFMDLWDSLLRGMPVGSMMASLVANGQAVDLITRQLVDIEGPMLELVDGQQRTLAMLSAWPKIGEDLPENEKGLKRRIWIDLADQPASGMQFRFHVTTENQPFGYARMQASGQRVGKLSRDERRQALTDLEEKLGVKLPKDFSELRKILWQNSRPFRSKLPIDLKEVLGHLENIEKLCNFLNEKAREAKCEGLSEDEAKKLPELVERNIKRLIAGAEKFRNLHMPVIEVSKHFDEGTNNDENEADPALAVLFKRVGTGGTELKDKDYVFSVIKHHRPECYTLVEAALNDELIKAIFSPVDLVATAVRLTAAELGKTDYPTITKAEFGRLMKNAECGEQKPPFLDVFVKNIGENGPFLRDLKALLAALSYKGDGDVGLPKHAICLLELEVVQSMLLWMQKSGISQIDEDNRLRMIRYAIYWHLAVHNKDKANREAFEFLKGNDGSTFPDAGLMTMLIKNGRAWRMVPPKTYADDNILKKMIEVPAIKGNGILRGGKRFDVPVLMEGHEPIDEQERSDLYSSVGLYKKFSVDGGSYVHKILLWLQRQYVQDKFETIAPLPGAEEETPYDFDHIIPHDNWNNDGRNDESSIFAFRLHPGNQEAWIGNSIGNVRVWDSSDNRGLGNAAAYERLQRADARQQSAVSDDEGWQACGEGRNWTRDRAIAFQKVVEQRTFNLYKQLYNGLRFNESALDSTK